MAWETADGRVVEALQARLQTISTAAGYYHTVKATSVVVDPTLLLEVPITELPALMLEPRPADVSPLMGHTRRVQRVRITVWGRVDGPSTEAKRRAAYRLARDIERAVSQDRTLGGTVVQAVTDAPDILLGPPPSRAAIVALDIEAVYERAEAA